MGSFEDESQAKEYWWNKASDLKKAAAMIWLAIDRKVILKPDCERTLLPEFGGSHSVCRLLYGLSLELLFKCLIVAQGQKPPAIHDLMRLSENAGVTYEEAEQKLLHLLTETIRWEGKYPVPLSEDEWNSMCELEGIVLYNAVPLGDGGLCVAAPNDNWGWQPYDNLFEKAASQLTL